MHRCITDIPAAPITYYITLINSFGIFLSFSLLKKVMMCDKEPLKHHLKRA